MSARLFRGWILLALGTILVLLFIAYSSSASTALLASGAIVMASLPFLIVSLPLVVLLVAQIGRFLLGKRGQE